MNLQKTVLAMQEKITRMHSNKKGIYAIDLLISGALGLMVLALIVVLVLIILGQMQSNTTLAPVNSAAYNGLVQASSAVGTIPTWFVVIITVVVAVGLIALVMVIRQAAGGSGGAQ